MHPADVDQIRAIRAHPPGGNLWTERGVLMFQAAGAPDADVAELIASGRPRLRPVLPDRLLEDGVSAGVPGRTVIGIWTPGHSPGHMCFEAPDEALLFGGDHLLPTISPHIGLLDYDSAADPLGNFLWSLDRLEARAPATVLPAHQYRYAGLHDRTRSLREHHQERLEALRVVLRAGSATAWEIAARLPWNRAWDTLDSRLRH
jgi:glyoxylase-like metal-dependent hydrolase (beta-lactamase superfamily II)